MPYRKLTLKEIEKWVGIEKKHVPKHLIIYCTWIWPIKKHIKEMKRYLRNPKLVGGNSLGLVAGSVFGNYWIGNMNGKKVGFMIVYGHGMTADMLYLMARLGVKYVYQIGSMGALQKHVELFDIVIPKKATKFEGLVHLPYEEEFAECDKQLLNMTEKILNEKKFKNYHVGKTISIDYLFAETRERVEKWQKEGLLAVDMETATTYAMAKLMKIKAIAILRIVDSVVKEGQLVSDLEYRRRRNEAHMLKKNVRDILCELIQRTN
jgi:purine-nucleoside phosphorylase